MSATGRTAWSSSAFTPRNSRSSTSLRTWRARSRTSASAIPSRSLQNNYWPAHYFIDAQGRIRYHHFGEGDYDASERVIRQLLAEAGHAPAGAPMTKISGTGAQAAAAADEIGSPETYIGYA